MPDPLYKLVDARHGRFLVNPNDQYIGASMIAYGEWGEAEVRLFLSLLKPADTAVEVGSNIGAHTVPISKAVGNAGLVHAFEPQRLIHQMLNANLALNDCLNVHAHLAAVSNKPGVAEICSIPPHHRLNYGALSLGFDLADDSHMESVPVHSIDELDLPKLDFLKIDAEGHDLSVLHGAHASITRCRPVLFVEATSQAKPGLLDTLRDHDYEGYWYVSAMHDAHNHRANPEYIWAYQNYIVVSIDLLAVPREQGWEISGLCAVGEKPDFEDLPLHPDNYFSGVTIKRP